MKKTKKIALSTNPKTRNAPLENVVESDGKVCVTSEDKGAQGDQAGEPRAKENEEDKLKARLKEYGSNITFSSVTGNASKSEQKSKHPTERASKPKGRKTDDEVSWTDHPLLPKGWHVALLQEPPSQLLPGLNVVPLQGVDKQTMGKIQLRAPGGRVLGSHGEAAAFMEEDGSYGEEDIQNLYKVTLVQAVKKTVNKKKAIEGTRKPEGLISGGTKKSEGTLSGGSGCRTSRFLLFKSLPH